MDKKRWEEIEPILDQALSIENPVKRREFIKTTCDDRQLKNDVSEMIRAIKKAEEAGFME